MFKNKGEQHTLYNLSNIKIHKWMLNPSVIEYIPMTIEYL